MTGSAEIGSAMSSSFAAGRSAGRASGCATSTPIPFERRPYGGGVEEIGRREQAVAAAAHALQRQPCRFRLLEQLRDAGARQPHRRGEVFAGVEGAVRKLAQQRESKRSEHKPTSVWDKSMDFSMSGMLCAPARIPRLVQMRAISARFNGQASTCGPHRGRLKPAPQGLLLVPAQAAVLTGTGARIRPWTAPRGGSGPVRWTRTARGSCLRRSPARPCAG